MKIHDLNDLAYFTTVVDHGGFAPAERATGIPKSKLSRRVAELEERLGVRLLQRSTRRFALTDIGAEYVRHCRAMLAEAEAAEALIHEQTSEPRGMVRISCPPALLDDAVGDLLARFLNAWPQVRVTVLATNRRMDVWHDGIDLALRVRLAPDAPGRLSGAADEVVRPLAVSPHVLVAAPSLLTNAPPPHEPADLARLPTLGLAPASLQPQAPEAFDWFLHGPDGRTETVRHSPRLVADDMGALYNAALLGVGCASLPLLVVHEALQSGRLQPILPGWAPPAETVQAAYASRRGMRASVRQLLDALVTGFERLADEGRCLGAVR